MLTNVKTKMNSSDESRLLCKGQQTHSEITWECSRGAMLKVRGYKDSVIDFTSGILVANLGHGNPRILAALVKVFTSSLLHSYHYNTRFKENYLRLLHEFVSELFEDPTIYLTSSGTEATETALKLMLRSHRRTAPPSILSVKGNYHGRTMGAALMGGGSLYAEQWPNLSRYFPKIDFPYKWEVSNEDGANYFHSQISSLSDNQIESVCGIVFETFQGWCAGFYPESFVQAAVQFARTHRWIVTFDEMQSGFYRTGLKFGFQHYNIKPDLICIGKGMGGGVPLSGVIGERWIMDLALEGELSSTHSANPLCCAIGTAVIKQMSQKRFLSKLKENCNLFVELGCNIASAFHFLEKRSTFSGMVGALVFEDGISVKGAKIADIFCEETLSNGLLVIRTGRESVKLAPPLTIDKRRIIDAFNVIKKALLKINKDYYS